MSRSFGQPHAELVKPGQVFGDLTVIDVYSLDRIGDDRMVAMLRCRCGVRRLVNAGEVYHQRSCGFYCRLRLKEMAERQRRKRPPPVYEQKQDPPKKGSGSP